jgi:hypothetical protein
MDYNAQMQARRMPDSTGSTKRSAAEYDQFQTKKGL